MITQGQFQASLNESIRLLQDLLIYKGKGLKAVGNHSVSLKKVAKSNRHTDIYRTALENKDYEILLFDDSIFQFSYANDLLRYCFIQNPSNYVSKADYLASILDQEDFLALSGDELTELINVIDENEYEQFVNEQELNLNANIIRYDMAEIGYAPLIHSYSHFHIGLNPSFRIPCSKILTPLKFVFFSIKHTYYREWKAAVVDGAVGFSHRIRDSKVKCTNLPGKFWSAEEQFELYLT